MGLPYHPEQGTVVICDFRGLKNPEMTKRRPAVIISPRLRDRHGLAAVVPLSTTDPRTVAPYHHRLHFDPPLPAPWCATSMWVKADMVYTFSFGRMHLPFIKKDETGKREYDVRVVDRADLIKIQECVLNGLGLMRLTNYL